MVLDDVPQTAGGFLKRTTILHAKFLGHRDLDAGDTVAVPDRFQKRIGEAKIEDIHDLFFPKEVVDTEDRVLRECRSCDAVEAARGCQVAPERLFNDDPRLIGQTCGIEPFDYGRK